MSGEDVSGRVEVAARRGKKEAQIDKGRTCQVERRIERPPRVALGVLMPHSFPRVAQRNRHDSHSLTFHRFDFAKDEGFGNDRERRHQVRYREGGSKWES